VETFPTSHKHTSYGNQTLPEHRQQKQKNTVQHF
jgi:hypothetical protein